jgi:hypothetical protein
MAEDGGDQGGQDPRHPKSTYGAKYPMNRVNVTESGHEVHLDDTKGKERIRIAHMKGTYTETNEKGKQTNLVVDNRIDYTKGGSTETVDKNKDTKIGGSSRKSITGDSHHEVKGSASAAVGKNHKTTVGGDYVKAVKGDEVKGVAGKKTTKVGGDSKVKVDGKHTHIVDGEATYKHGSGTTFSDEQKITFKVGGSTIVMEPGKITQQSSEIHLNPGGSTDSSNGGGSSNSTQDQLDSLDQNKVDFSKAQNTTPTQKTQAQENMGTKPGVDVQAFSSVLSQVAAGNVNGTVGASTPNTGAFTSISATLGALFSASQYLNFGTTIGTTGYGFRDNGGVLEFKDSGGGWSAFSTFLSSGAVRYDIVQSLTSPQQVQARTNINAQLHTSNLDSTSAGDYNGKVGNSAPNTGVFTNITSRLTGTGSLPGILLDQTSLATKRQQIQWAQNGVIQFSLFTDGNLDNTRNLYLYDEARGATVFYVDPNGTMTFVGNVAANNINANTGTFANVAANNITGNAVSVNTGTFKNVSSNVVTITSGYYTTGLHLAGNNSTGFGGGYLSSGDLDGLVIASGAEFNGTSWIGRATNAHALSLFSQSMTFRFAPTSNGATVSTWNTLLTLNAQGDVAIFNSSANVLTELSVNNPSNTAGSRVALLANAAGVIGFMQSLSPNTTAIGGWGPGSVIFGGQSGNVFVGPIDSNYLYLQTGGAGTKRVTVTPTGLVGINAVPVTLFQVGDAGGLAATNDAFLAFSFNNQHLPPVIFGGALGFHYSGGAGEVDLWNCYNGAGTSFSFKQMTGGSTYKDVLNIHSNGVSHFVGNATQNTSVYIGENDGGVGGKNSMRIGMNPQPGFFANTHALSFIQALSNNGTAAFWLALETNVVLAANTNQAIEMKSRSGIGQVMPNYLVSGCYGDGVADDSTALNSIVSTYNVIEFFPGIYNVGADSTWGSGDKTFIVHRGAKINVASGKTLSIRGPFDAPRDYIFTGSGSVTGISNVFPEWWGANTSSGDCGIGVNKAIACAEAVGDCVMSFATGAYRFASTATFNITPANNWKVFGTGSFNTDLQANTTFVGNASAAVINFHPVDLGGYSTGTFLLEDLAIRNMNATSSNCAGYGFFVGSSSIHLNTTILSWARVNRVHVAGFFRGFMAWNTSGIIWTNCDGNCSGLADDPAHHGGIHNDVTVGGSIFCLSGPANVNSATTEHHFHDCQSISDLTGSGLLISDLGNSNVVCGGIGISGFDFYGIDNGTGTNTGTYLSISASGFGSSLGDIWITGSRNQFEGTPGATTTAIDVRAVGTNATHMAQITDIHVSDCYVTGFGHRHGFKASTGNYGTIWSCFVNNNWFNNSLEEAVFIDGAGTGTSMYGFTVHDNFVNDYGSAAATGCGIYVEKCDRTNIHDNYGKNSTVVGAFIKVVNCNYIGVHDNISGGNVSNAWTDSGCTNPNIHNNI